MFVSVVVRIAEMHSWRPPDLVWSLTPLWDFPMRVKTNHIQVENWNSSIYLALDLSTLPLIVCSLDILFYVVGGQWTYLLYIVVNSWRLAEIDNHASCPRLEEQTAQLAQRCPEEGSLPGNAQPRARFVLYLCYGAQNHGEVVQHRDLQWFVHATYLKHNASIYSSYEINII